MRPAYTVRVFRKKKEFRYKPILNFISSEFGKMTEKAIYTANFNHFLDNILIKCLSLRTLQIVDKF